MAIPRTIVLVMLGWVFFRAWTLPQAWGYLETMLGPTHGGATVGFAAIARPWTVPMLAGAAMLAVAPLWTRSPAWLGDWIVVPGTVHESRSLALRAGVCTALVAASFVIVASSEFSPFIYFQF
jgi:hypothetical protein